MLSRATRAIDVHIVGEFCKEAIKCDTKYALPESERLLRIFDEQQSIEKESKENLIKISYLNVRSMKASDGHRKDIALDNVIMDSDMFGLAETWLEKDQEIHFDGFNGYFANFGNGKGVAGYNKLDLVSQPETVSSKTYSAIMFKGCIFVL